MINHEKASEALVGPFLYDLSKLWSKLSSSQAVATIWDRITPEPIHQPHNVHYRVVSNLSLCSAVVSAGCSVPYAF